MSFHFAKWTGPLFAGLVLCLSPLAQAQSAGSGQQIIFSTPDGKTVANAPLPAAQAPQPQEQFGSSQASPFSDFNQRMPDAMFPAPSAVPIPRDSRQKSFDERQRMGLLTPAEIMRVPTLEQIFGLPERNTGNTAMGGQTNLFSSENQTTNIISSGESGDSSSSLESNWQKILLGNSGASASTNESIFNSRATNNSGGLLSEIFNGRPDKDKKSFFDNDDKIGSKSAFGSFGTASQQPNPNSFANGFATPSAGYAGYSSGSTFGSGQDSQSPFALPKSSTLDSLPKLPSVPTVSGQNNYNNSTPQPVPSWEPKPPPWATSTPALGTMPQRKF